MGKQIWSMIYFYLFPRHFLNQKGISVFHSQPNPYIFNANLINLKLQFIVCKACNCMVSPAERQQVLTCYMCGVHVHMHCAISSRCMLNVQSASGTRVCMCVDCIAQSVDAIQIMLIKNELAAMNHIISVDSNAHLPRLFQRKILELASKLKPENKETYAKLELEVYLTFFAKPGNVMVYITLNGRLSH